MKSGQDGKTYRVQDIDNKGVKAVAVVGSGTLKGRKSIKLGLDNTVHLFRRAGGGRDVSQSHRPG